MIAAGTDVRSDPEIEGLKAQRGGVWPAIRAVHRRRPLLTALVVIAAPIHAVISGSPIFDLMGPDRSWRFYLPWILVVIGVAVRLWGSGNLRKNQEITESGIYQLVRHPLYLGSLAFFLAFFLTVTDPLVGLMLFAGLVLLVYYPTMLSEEEYLALRFPGLVSSYSPPPRLFPDPRRLPAAFRSDRFDLTSAYRNLGFRSVWFALGLPLILRLLRWLQTFIG